MDQDNSIPDERQLSPVAAAIQNPIVNGAEPLVQIPWKTEDDPRVRTDVVNLSGALLSNDQIALLSLGLNFRASPAKVPYFQLVAGAEMVARDIAGRNYIHANAFHIACSNTIQRAAPPAPNLNSHQRRAIRELRNNHAISILLADKGGKTVVLDTNQYSTLCIDHLETDEYELVSTFGRGRGLVTLWNPKGDKVQEFVVDNFESLDGSDLLLKMQCQRLTDLLTRFWDTGEISAQDRRKVLPAQPFSGKILQFYGSPKIHKVGQLKIRPIVSNIDIYCDRLLMHLKLILNKLFRSEFAVLNSYDFVSRLENVNISAHDRLASLDVESLFTKVLVD